MEIIGRWRGSGVGGEFFCLPQVIEFDFYFLPCLSQSGLTSQANKFMCYQMALIINGMKLVPLYLNNWGNCRVDKVS